MTIKRTRVLLVDDEEAFARALKSYLEETRRYEVRIEHSGARGLSAAREFQPDVILLDVIMPDLDGGTVASRMREDESLATTPVIFLTAVVSRNEASTHAGFIGGQWYLAKPISGREVREAIERVINHEPMGNVLNPALG